MNVIFTSVERVRFGWVPDLSTLDWRALVLSCIAAILLLRLRFALLNVLAMSSALALGISFL